MFVLICYDVGTTDNDGPKRLRHIAKLCQDYGQRVQFSIFECIVTPDQWVQLREKLIREMDMTKDSLRFYYLGANWKRKVEHVGAKQSIDQEGPLIL